MTSGQTQTTQRERALIGRGDAKRPYGARVQFQVLTHHSIRMLEDMTLLLDAGPVVALTQGHSTSWEGGRRYIATLEGFASAAAAETEGARLSQAFLLLAVSLDFGLRLEFQGRQRATVFERFRGAGLSVRGEGAQEWPQEVVLASMGQALACPALARPVLLSMELYGSALLEPNERARFIAVVSALEPLADPQSLGPAVGDFARQAAALLNDMPDVDEAVRRSLQGRLGELRRESVSQALQRLCRTQFPRRPDMPETLKRVYELRSQLIHNGQLDDSDVNLSVETARTANLLRLIYQHACGFRFKAQPQG